MMNSVRGERTQFPIKSLRPILSSQKKRRFNSARISTLSPIAMQSPTTFKRNNTITIPVLGDLVKEPEDSKEINDIDYEPVADENIPIDFFQNISGMKSSHTFSLIDFHSNIDPKLLELPPLPKMKSSTFSEVFDQKIELCNYICDFYNPDLDKKAKVEKKNALEEIYNIISKQELVYKFQTDQITQVLTMCKNNIIRNLPVLNYHQIFSEDLPPVSDPSWPHLNLVYQILLYSLQYFDEHPMFTFQFILDLLPMMQSPDPTERQLIDKFIIQYLKCREGKSTKSFNSILLQELSRLLNNHIESNTPPFIVGPILQIYNHIFQCTRQDANTTSKVYNQILRLLSDYHLSTYEDQFYSIIDFFSDESSAFALMLAKALVLHWPKTCAEKEASFVNMLMDVMPKISSRNLSPLITRIFSILAECVSSSSLKVAEQTFKIWISQRVEPILNEHSKKIVYLSFEKVLLASRNHWSKTVRSNLQTVLQTMQKISPRSFDGLPENSKTATPGSPFQFSRVPKIGLNLLQTQQNEFMKKLKDMEQAKKKVGVSNWAEIARMAAKRDKKINLGKKLSEITMLFNGTLKPTIKDQLKK